MEPSIIQDETCVGTNVKVSPDVKINHVKTNFVGDPVVEIPTQDTPECSYTVSQMLCLEYSVDFAADVETGDAWIVCGPDTQDTHAVVCPDVHDGPSVSFYEPVDMPEYKKAPISGNIGPQKDCGCGCGSKVHAFPDVQEGPSVTRLEQDEKAPEHKKARASGNIGPQKDCGCGSHAQVFPDMQKEPPASRIEQKKQESPGPQASIKQKEKNIKQPASRFAGRKIAISKATYESAFGRNLSFIYSKR